MASPIDRREPCGAARFRMIIRKIFGRHMTMEVVSALIGEIYDAAIDPGLWPRVLVRIASYVRAARALLILEDALQPRSSIAHTSFDDDEWLDQYRDTYLLINPMRIATGAEAREGQVILTSDFSSPGEYRRTRFYREFLAARSMADVSAAVLEKGAVTISVLSVIRDLDQGMAGPSVRRKLALLAPHVRRACMIGRLLEHRSLMTDGLAAVLDRLSGSVLLLDAMGDVVHVNESGREILSGKGPIHVRHGRLSVRDEGARVWLRTHLARLREGENEPREDMFGAVLGFQSGRRLVATFLPLTRGPQSLPDRRHGAVAALFVREAAFDTAEAARPTGPIYGLTPREMSVLAATAEFGGAREVASILGLSENTVKTHLKSVSRKTGACGRAELIRLLASISTPFRS